MMVVVMIMSVAFLTNLQIFLGILLKTVHTAWSTKIIGLVLMLGCPLCSFGLNFHFADRVNDNHSYFTPQLMWVLSDYYYYIQYMT